MQVKRLSEQNEVKEKTNTATEKTMHDSHFEAMQKIQKDATSNNSFFATFLLD
jgi:hypothetical protein